MTDNNSVCRLCRRENKKLMLKGDKCNTPKCPFTRRPYGPGQTKMAKGKKRSFCRTAKSHRRRSGHRVVHRRRR